MELTPKPDFAPVPEAVSLDALEAQALSPHETRWQFLVRQFRKNPLGQLGLALTLLLVLAAVASPLFATHDPIKIDLSQKLLQPSFQHWFGTDEMGRDIYSRIIYGSRVSVESGLVVLAIGATLGILLGALAGYLGGWVDEVVMRVTDMFLAFPSLVLAIAIAAVLGPGMLNAMIAIAATWWPAYARLVRGQVLTIRKQEYILAARSIGAGKGRIMARHVLPNCITPITVQITMDLGYAILTTASLSFMGLGAQPPTPEWGAMIASGRTYLLSYWWYPAFPGIAIFVAVLGFNLLGDALRDILDPRSRG